MKRYPTARPYLGKKEERYVLKALRSGVLSIGPFIEKFEKKFAREIGSKYAVGVSSGTGGLHLALLAAGIGAGDEVITSPFSFVASANVILYVGATPVFADIDRITYNIDPKEIEKKITPSTKAILPVHIFGQPADMDEIMRIAREHKLLVIEDACESLLSTYKGKCTGTFGHSGVFAFYANKQMTTGEGGMVVTDDAKVAEHLRSLRNQGRAPNMRWLDHNVLGYNYRLNEMSAALGLAQIENIGFLVRKRQELARWYGEALAPLSGLVDMPRVGANATHTWFVYVVALKDPAIDRNAVIDTLKKRGVHTKPYLPSIHLFDFYRKLGHREGEFPISESLSQRAIALPFYIGLTKRDVAQIAKILKDVIISYEK